MCPDFKIWTKGYREYFTVLAIWTLVYRELVSRTFAGHRVPRNIYERALSGHGLGDLRLSQSLLRMMRSTLTFDTMMPSLVPFAVGLGHDDGAHAGNDICQVLWWVVGLGLPGGGEGGGAGQESKTEWLFLFLINRLTQWLCIYFW